MEENIRLRIEQLIADAPDLREGDERGKVQSKLHAAQCKAWLIGALNVVRIIFDDPANLYRKEAESMGRAINEYYVHENVCELSELLSSLLTDIKLGLVSSVANRARAETFDEFLDHAEAYHKQGRKDQSGVIAGVVFEDSIRRICEKYSIPQKGQKLEDLISTLAKQGIISQAKAKRARAAAHVRTKASHAQWDEFDLSDVWTTIELTREISEKLGS